MGTKHSRLFLTLLATLAVQACSSDGGMPVAPLTGVGSAPVNTTLPAWGVRKTAIPYWNRDVSYDWDITKTITPSSLTLALGQSGTFNFTVTATRTETSSSSSYGMTGEICVFNNSGAATVGLRIEDRLFQMEPPSDVNPLVEIVIDVSSNPELDNGESHCYPYSLTMPAGFAADPAGVYKNKAYVLSQDETGKLVRVTEHEIAVIFPAEPTATETDASASVVDQLTCPTGFTCTPSGANWTFGSTGSQPLAVVVKNINAPCNSQHQVVNRATLTEGTSGETRGPATATGNVTTPTCLVFQDETAVSAGTRWPGTSNWFMYMAYTTNKVDLIAGQHYDAGDIFMSRVGSNTIIRIVMQNGFTWADVEENLKIHPMDRAPTAYVQPGAFLYKFTVSGNTVTVTIPGTSARFYGIHGDVGRLVAP